jgi:hypothetical protein
MKSDAILCDPDEIRGTLVVRFRKASLALARTQMGRGLLRPTPKEARGAWGLGLEP